MEDPRGVKAFYRRRRKQNRKESASHLMLAWRKGSEPPRPRAGEAEGSRTWQYVHYMQDSR